MEKDEILKALSEYNLQNNEKLSILDFENEEDWLELRTKGIGGSDIGAILGLNPYSSPLKIYKQKVEGYREDLSDNIFVKKGKELEDFILTNYVKPVFNAKGYMVRKPQFMITNSDYPFFRANIDGLAYRFDVYYNENIILEIKFVSEYAEVNWNKPTYNGVPASYYAQVQLYMAVTGIDKAVICALFDRTWEMHFFEIPRDDIFIANMINIARNFYQYNMCMRIPPKPSYELDKEDCTKAIKEAKTPTTPSKELTNLINTYLSNEEKIKKAEEVQKQIKDKIFNLATAGNIPEDSSHKVKITTVTSSRFNSTKFKTDYPDLYEQYCEDSESPRMTIK